MNRDSVLSKVDNTTGNTSGWLTPFKKQCFVTFGVCLHMSTAGLTMGYASILIPQLRHLESLIHIDESSGSWIASIVGCSLVTGNLAGPPITSYTGRIIATLIGIAIMITGWLIVYFAKSIPALLVARFIQGTAMGMSTYVGPILIGEYTTPRNRGAFIGLVSLYMATGVCFVQTLGSYAGWQTTALVCAIISIVNFIIILNCPESPSFLAYCGKYDESRRVFRWLRGNDEDEELEKMIEASMILRETKANEDVNRSLGDKIKSRITYAKDTIRKKEFYRPIIIMIHIYTMTQWSGANILATYIVDIATRVLGGEHVVDIPLVMVSLGIQRIISNAFAIIFIKKYKRRNMLLSTISLNIFALLATSAYTFCRLRGMLPFPDHPGIGIGLLHLHMFTIATGCVPMQHIIAGELFPIQYKGLAGGFSILFSSGNLFVSVKNVAFLLRTIGIHGAYLLYTAIVSYCLTVAWLLMPETKDKTLQEIEEEFRGGPLWRIKRKR